MKLTNEYGLPSAFERYEAKDSYSKGEADFSITTLIDAPQIRHLREVHDHELSEDISGRIMALLGTAIHRILECGVDDGDIAEHRFYADVNGVTISGQCDRLRLLESPDDTKRYGLQDYKTVSGTAMVINPGGQSSWEKQLNGYAYLATENGYVIEDLEVLAIVRDWSHAQVRRNQNFPKHAVVKVPINLWPYSKQKEFIEKCVADHKAETPRECNDEEKWHGKKTYAVMEYKKSGGLKSRATKLFESHTEAEMFIIEKGLTAEVFTRDKVPTRCVGNYCLVSQYCDQFQNE